MLALPGYQILAQIYESASSLVYRGIRNQDNQLVILKVLKQEYPPLEELTRYQQEYKITRSLNLEGVVKAYDLQKYQNTLVMLLEDFGGASLKALMANRKFKLAEFLAIAIRITEVVAEIHKQNIIHKDINPSNIVFNPATGQLKIIDFGIATALPKENPIIKNPNVLEGTLAYISPEQTGRMNRSLDYRTDFYSLGATFYELLVQQVPFEATDAMELVHCHIALTPIAPNERSSEIPKPISDIVMKLLAKTAEERYQSAWGIKADLEVCLQQLQTKDKIEDFLLGRQDISNKFQIPQKLYGREQEIATLMTAFERVSQGHSEMMLVSGYSGIGKSALVQEIYKPITRQRGYFISGKFDQFQSNIPYSAVVNAFRELVRQLLAETEDRLNRWREKLLAAFGPNGQIIIDVIPEVELIVGKQPVADELPPAESYNRFNLVFQNFISVFAKPEHPLVIFLDDLQWADSASLQLIQLLMSKYASIIPPGDEKGRGNANSQYLFLIGAYRDNEVFNAHPLMLTLNEIKKTETIINHIFLSNLKLDCVTQLIAETLKSEIEIVKPLAELVLRKTNGNPFFVNEFLQKNYTEDLLEFDFEQRIWQFNLKQIQTLQNTNNVVDLLIEKIQKLPNETQQIIKLAACVGNKFNLKTLSFVNKKSQSETASKLWDAVLSGLVIPIDSNYKMILSNTKYVSNGLEFNYKFSHDKVQQAAYCLIPDDCKKNVHLQVGKLLLENPDESLEEKIFNVVNQLNLGTELIVNQQDKDELAWLNLTAGKKAKASAAYEPALNYLNVGIGLLDADSWEKHYQLTLCIFVEAVEAAYLSGHFEQMEKLTEVVLQRAKTLLERVKVYEVKIQAYRTQNKLREAVKIGIAVLNLLNIFPKQPDRWHVFLSRVGTKLSLVGKQIEDLIDLPEMTNPDKLAAMQILSRTWSVAYLATPELLPLIVVKMVHLSVKYGNTSVSAYAYATYGLLLCGVLGDIDSGYQFGQLALSLLARLNAKELKAKTYMVVNTFIRHWKEHINVTLQPLLEAYQTGLEIGDLEYLAYSALNYCAYSYLIGKELSELEREIATYSEAIHQFKQESCVRVNELYRQAVLNLMGYTENPCQLVGESFDEEKMLPFYLEANDRAAISFIYINKIILCYLFAEYNRAAEYAAVCKQYLDGVIGTPNVPLFTFYDSLTLLAVFPTAQNLEKKHILRKVAANQNKMKKWAAHAPMNYLHKFHLIEAERLRVSGQAAKAMDYYDRAIESAKKYEYINEEALAHELAAKFYLTIGKDKIAQVYMVNAHYCYLKWGATGKVRDLEARYPELLFKQSLGDREPSFLLKTSSSNTTRRHELKALDLSTVMKASQAISGEIVLERLLTKLMKILIENAGAQKGFLILETKGKLLIEAAGAVDTDNVTVLQSVPVESSQNVSSAIVNYVARTKESVVLNEATSENKFTSDPYLQEQKPKSILCTPLINQGQPSAILYLENNLTTAAFTPDRLEVLKLLSTQAAISINLAQLYSQLRESEHRLAQFLEAVPVGLTILDVGGRVYYTNRTAQQLLGKGVVPDTMLEQLPEVYQVYISGTKQLYPYDQLAIAQALRGERATHDDLEIHQGDKVIPIESWGTPIYDEKGNVVYAMAAFQDITERKRAEAERLKFTNQLVQLNQAYSHFVPCQFLQLLNKESIVDVKLGDQVQKEMTILFSDIRNFTTLSEMMVPEDNFKFINAYLSRMEPAIIENHGFIDKYIGDAIMALFSGNADDAVEAGIAMLHRLTEYNTTRVTTTRPPIRIGIGINTGSLMLGTVGGANRMDGTVISDAVNLASRIEGLTKDYCVSLLISHHTFLSLQNPNQYAIRILDRVKVKGKSELVTVYEVFDGDLPEVREGKLITKTTFEKALMLYSVGAVSEAVKLFQDCLHVNPRDTVAQIYLERCRRGS